MSLITIDDDSNDDVSIILVSGDNEIAMKESSKETSDDKSKGSSDNVTDIEDEESSNSKSNDTDLFLPVPTEGTSDSITIDTGGNNDDTKEKPILELMKHLINYDGEQNTMLTNAELIKMLKNEFNIDVPNLPSISVEIYMNVLKNFLKEWPQWDEFDHVMHESRCMDDNDEIEQMLQRKYTALREYLAAMLKATRPFAREAAQRIKRNASASSISIPSTSQIAPGDDDVILEINCTRSQLNTLFFRKPNPHFNNTIFNVENALPSKISIVTPSLQSILNGCHVRLSISMDCFKYKRELIHDLKHKLVNKKNHQPKMQDNKLNVHLQTPKALPRKDKMLSKKDINAITTKIVNANRYIGVKSVETIFQIINDDVGVIEGNFGIPASFRYYMNPYAYVRHLNEDVGFLADEYDLHLEERLAPRLKFQITKISLDSLAVNSSPNWLKLECMFCDLSFLGLEGVELLKEHFRDYHQDEPDLMCTNCDRKFSVNILALSRWYHKCGMPEAVIFHSDTE